MNWGNEKFRVSEKPNFPEENVHPRFRRFLGLRGLFFMWNAKVTVLTTLRVFNELNCLVWMVCVMWTSLVAAAALAFVNVLFVKTPFTRHLAVIRRPLTTVAIAAAMITQKPLQGALQGICDSARNADRECGQIVRTAFLS